MMRVYVTGPMSNKIHGNLAAFQAAAAMLEADGLEPHTPFEAANVVWQRHHGRDFDPINDVCGYGSVLIKEIFLEDLRLLLSCDSVYMLPGWEDSRGVKVEKALAELFNVPIMYRSGTEQKEEHSITVFPPTTVGLMPLFNVECSCGAKWTAENYDKVKDTSDAHRSYGQANKRGPD